MNDAPIQQTKDTLRLPRSPHWPELRRQWLQDHPTCAACGSVIALEVHHIIPVHVNRSLELTPANLITLCEEKPDDPSKPHHCHLAHGHLGNWFNWNRNVLLDANKALLSKYENPLKPKFGFRPSATADSTPTESSAKTDSAATAAAAADSSSPQSDTVSSMLQQADSNPAAPADPDKAKEPDVQRVRHTHTFIRK